MSTVILVRHGRTTANASGLLAGRTPGVGLDETGRAQAERAARRLAPVPLARVVSSPLQRCQETRAILLAGRADDPPSLDEDGLTECDYGDWQGRTLKDLAHEDLWRTVQSQPSAATFPGGESMRAMSRRAVDAVRAHDAAVEAEHGTSAVWVAVSHGDLIKAVLADALGLHLDHFQRITADPASISIVRYTAARPYVVASNTHDGDLDWLVPDPAAPDGDGAADAPVGGGAGPGAPSGARS